ncbi:MAG: RluA family pseudouridine synthase, partial [Limosilactobacillus mucosae]|nr:RluA family pseudouridine synthase [Limosilactobacillus mucosae]
GKAAVTEYWLKYPGLNASIVKIRLHTGRTHQIRVHFSYLHRPTADDQDS